MGNSVSFRDKHVLITGGSTGIGLALADVFVRDGARVTLLARDEAKLASAKDKLLAKYPAGNVQTLSADVTNYSELATKITTLEKEKYGGVEVAICNAGMSIPGLYVEQSIDVTNKQMAVNFFGVHHTAKAVLPGMLARGSGHLCFIASAAGLIGLVGYSSYSPTKYAVRGLADCLRNELQGTGVTVSIGYPPDTKTPGFERENTTKPKANLAISDFFADTVYEPEVVAASLFRGLKRGRYHLPNPDFMQTLLISLCSGVTPKPLGTLLEMLFAPLIILIARVYCYLVDSIVRKHNKAAGAAARQHPAKSD